MGIILNESKFLVDFKYCHSRSHGLLSWSIDISRIVECEMAEENLDCYCNICGLLHRFLLIY